MSQCVVPSWNLRHQRQEQVEGEEGNRSPHVYTQQHPNHHVPMSNYEVTELTWKNGQLAMHGLGGLVPTAPAKPTWVRTGGTLESVVHQATTCHKRNPNLVDYDRTPANINSVVASSTGKWADNSGDVHIDVGLTKKRRPNPGPCQRHCSSSAPEEGADRSACASASATFWRDTDTTMMTWPSFESPGSLKTKTTEEDSACQGGLENPDEERETKTETGRSHSTRRSRAAAVHNQSERKRRDKINQKMKALQKLVPNSSKIDKASMLDEVIEYMKQLQAQVQMMSVRNIPQMMMPLGMQQHLQMSLLARMGMGMGLGMGMGVLDMNAMARSAPQSIPPLLHHPQVAVSTPTFVPPPFIVPPMMPAHTTAPPNPDTSTNTPIAMHDPYCALLTQSMNIDLYNKMAALYRQQVSQTPQAATSPQPVNHAQRD